MSIIYTTLLLMKRVQPSKILVEKSCEIKGGGHEMAAVMLMIIYIIYCPNSVVYKKT